MSSINQNQPEHNRDDLAGPQAVDKIRALVDKAQTCFFCTKVMVRGSTGARPMNVRKVDDNGSLWFLSADDSHLNHELARDPSVHLYFQASPHSGFLHLTGRARVTRNPAMIHELWEPMIKTWFTQGESDPRITVIEVVPTEGYYWDVKHGNMVAGIKMMIGAAMGETLDDSIEGAIRL